MNKHKNGKLLIEVGIITLIMFALTLTFTSQLTYFITKESYLNSKNEMIDRDLNNSVGENSGMDKMPLKWLISYINEHREDMTRAYTEEEQALRRSDEISESIWNMYVDHELKAEEQSEDVQFFYARDCLELILVNLSFNVEKTGYSSMFFIDISDEHEAYLLARVNSSTPYDLEQPGYDDFGKMISYEASDHSAVKKILQDGLNPGETIYEVYTDPTDGKDYYIGYILTTENGEPVCIFGIKYDWSQFHSELRANVISSMLWGLLVLIALNSLLMGFIYIRAIAPLTKVKQGVIGYMRDKDSAAVNNKMSSIKVRNEIGLLADSFSELAAEIDRYTEENLKLGAEKEHIATELSLATSIQVGMLPNMFPLFPERKEFDVYASMDPAKEVGGDFYDFFLVDDDHLGMVIADVSGKGVPAALFMMAAKILINDHALMGGTPAEILARVNKQVCANNDAHMFVTVWLGILEISTGKLTASNAGHEYPMLNSNGRYEMLKDKHGMPIGAFKKSKYTNYEITLKKGDCIFVYTDGVAEATDANDELFGTERTVEVLNAAPDASPENILRNVRAAVDAFVKEAPQFDDLTMLAFRYLGTEENQ
jgi:serine phosphatase RsbU (regulator of sigma subunit)